MLSTYTAYTCLKIVQHVRLDRYAARELIYLFIYFFRSNPKSTIPRNGPERCEFRARDRYFKDLPTNAVVPEPGRENLGPREGAVRGADRFDVARQP